MFKVNLCLSQHAYGNGTVVQGLLKTTENKTNKTKYQNKIKQNSTNENKEKEQNTWIKQTLEALLKLFSTSTPLVASGHEQLAQKHDLSINISIKHRVIGT